MNKYERMKHFLLSLLTELISKITMKYVLIALPVLLI